MYSGVNCPIEFASAPRRTHPALALLASVLAHAGIALALASNAAQVGGSGAAGSAGTVLAGAAQPQRALIVRFVSPTPSATAARDPATATAGIEPAPAPTTAAPAGVAAAGGGIAAAGAETSPLAAGAREKPHYFGANAMTQEPVVAEGLVGGKLLVVPGIAPQAVAVQVWVSEEGAVERIALDTPMPQADEQLLLAAFAGVKFHPGRIGRIAVRSHLAMEIMLDDAIRL